MLSRAVLSLFFILSLATVVNAANSETPSTAIDGYCPVCVAASKRLIPGSPAFTTIHEGLQYRFASLRQKAAFLKNPNLFTEDLAKNYADAKRRASTRREGSGSRKREGSGRR